VTDFEVKPSRSLPSIFICCDRHYVDGDGTLVFANTTADHTEIVARFRQWHYVRKTGRGG
jgi:hypothetical protein